MSALEAIKRAQSAAPVDLEVVADALGVDVSYTALDNDISGEISKPNGDKFEIRINQNDPLTRQRFTLAHELGHFMFHRHLIGDGLDDNKAYRSTDSGRYHNKKVGPKQETEANRFAANLLMPHKLVNELKEQGLNRKQMAAILKVSEHAMAIRLGENYP